MNRAAAGVVPGPRTRPVGPRPARFPSRCCPPPMNRLVVSVTVLASAMLLGSPAHAKKAPPAPEPALSIPKVGDTLAPNGAPDWPQKLDWLYDRPSFKDATGKVVLHWFCVAKVSGCVDDLARVITLKENAKVYVIAYIDGAKGDAKKLDPIRGEEGVGRGTVAFGKNATSLIRRLGVTGPVSVVVGIDNKVAFVSTGQSPGRARRARRQGQRAVGRDQGLHLQLRRAARGEAGRAVPALDGDQARVVAQVQRAHARRVQAHRAGRHQVRQHHAARCSAQGHRSDDARAGLVQRHQGRLRAARHDQLRLRQPGGRRLGPRHRQRDLEVRDQAVVARRGRRVTKMSRR